MSIKHLLHHISAESKKDMDVRLHTSFLFSIHDTAIPPFLESCDNESLLYHDNVAIKVALAALDQESLEPELRDDDSLDDDSLDDDFVEETFSMVSELSFDQSHQHDNFGDNDYEDDDHTLVISQAMEDDDDDEEEILMNHPFLF